MSFDSLGNYTASFKSWDHIGNVIPDVEYSEGTRPHGEFKPAAWLPVQFFDKFYEDWFVIMPGKIIAMDNDGRIVPSQYNSSSATITYTTNDVAAGTIDVTTGAVVAAATSYAVSGVTSFMGRGLGALAVSVPVGVAPYAYWQWAGDGSSKDDGNNPAALKHHNYELQHRVAMVCDYVLELPLVPASTTATSLSGASYNGSTKLTTWAAVSNLPVAQSTTRTPITFAGTGHGTYFAVQKTALTDLTTTGDWFIDLTTGVVSTFGDSSALTLTIAYSNYASAPTGSNVSKFACALGALKAGDLLTFNADSNWIVDSSAGTYLTVKTMGQVIEIENVLGKDALDRVRTAFANLSTTATGALPGSAGQMDQMPGSANGGVPSKVAYAGGADKVVRINLITR